MSLIRILIALLALAATAPAADRDAAPVYQLRIYEIFEANKQAFHERFRDHAVRIMQRHDFRIVAMWESKTPERTEFVYLLEWPDRATLKDRWEKFLADEEWVQIKRRTRVHGQLVGEIEDRTIELADYSPRLERRP